MKTIGVYSNTLLTILHMKISSPGLWYNDVTIFTVTENCNFA